MFCPFCGAQLGGAPRFCPSCGQNVGFLTERPSTPSTSTSEGCGPTGPNQVWHVDGYDKLKPFGIAISGCIDGYSRRVMWLSSGSTNNDPAVIARYYLQCISNCGVVPARLRTDCGTENGDMAAIHCSLREDHTDEFAGPLSHMYGTSTANQRIESWWSFFRKQR
ncbi:hypothetical protein SKAU_G00019600 [Synaphobranchus kaupii]|uniref:Integrase core domain-containing protein n=1 Tax=Synaphobranchus kaupii TaxID=118154 RepID=A0A9Q1GDD1_SYNKA|nr:hypothetical protein SKAU_G00019600 [Synaphobranchus kaupii]